MITQFQLPRLTCLRCGHTWIPRTDLFPRRCASCRTPYWWTPRMRKRKRGILENIIYPQ